MSDDHLLMCCCCRAACQHIVEEKDAEIELLRGYRDAAEADAAVARLLLDKSRLTETEMDAMQTAIDTLHAVQDQTKDPCAKTAIAAARLMRLRDRLKPIENVDSDRSQPIGSPAKTNPTQPRNGTPVKGSVPGEGSVPDSRNWNEPVAWAVEDERGLQKALHPTAGHARCMARSYRTDGMEGKVVPLYRHPQPTLTDEEREAVEVAIIGGCEMAATLRKLLLRLA